MARSKKTGQVDLSDFKSTITAKNDEQKEMMRIISKNTITFVKGSPGTGKTFLAVAYALQQLSRGKFEKIVFTRPVIEAAGERLGFLPGDMFDKIDPYMIPIFDSLFQLLPAEVVKKMTKNNNESSIRILPLAFMRGVTFKNSIIICDECLTEDTKISVSNNGSISHRTSMKSIIQNPSKYQIISLNKNTGQLELKSISHIFCAGKRKTLKITVKGRKIPIISSFNHPFAVFENGEIVWKKASNLSTQDLLIRIKDGSNNSSVLHRSAYDIILGCILGDGCLTRNRSKQESYRLSKNHGISQYDYMLFFKNLLDGIERKVKSGYTDKAICGFQTKSYSIDNVFLSSAYRNNKKHLTSRIADYMTERTLAIWYMDDGSANIKNGKASIRFHTESFTKVENKILRDILYDKFKIGCHIDEYRGYYRLRLKHKDSEKLLSLISNLIYPSMSYKLPFDNQFNQDLYTYTKYDNLTVSEIDKIERGEIKDVFNLEVVDNNNFFANNILVHNCQNSTPEQIRMILTRIGEKSKIILCGDVKQSDVEGRNGLVDAFELLQELDQVGFVTLTKSAIVRHPIIEKIEDKYEHRIISKGPTRR